MYTGMSLQKLLRFMQSSYSELTTNEMQGAVIETIQDLKAEIFLNVGEVTKTLS